MPSFGEVMRLFNLTFLIFAVILFPLATSSPDPDDAMMVRLRMSNALARSNPDSFMVDLRMSNMRLLHRILRSRIIRPWMLVPL